MNQQKQPDIVSITAGDNRPDVGIEALLDSGGQTRTLRRTLFGVVGLVAVFLVWSVLAQVDELSRARGEIQPGGHVQVLQTEEGGSIVRLFVKEGDRVKAGDPIAEFATTNLVKDLEQADIKINSLAIERERMLAVLENRKPDFGPYAQDYPLLVEQAKVSYLAQVANRDAALAAKRSEAGQQSSLLGGLERDKRLIAMELREAQERLRRLEDGARKGVVTQISLSEARQQLAALEGRQADIESRAEATKGSIGGVDAETSRIRAELNQQLGVELGKITEQYRELVAEKKALEERQGRSRIKASMDGIVMNLPQTATGAVLPPGGVVAEIVPSEGEVVMEVMVTPRDIGFVKLGQRASVKIDSFDSARFGAVEGEVKRVAPTSTKMKENGMPFYKVEVALATPYVGSAEHRLSPGMTGEADIATGRKSVMQFLLKPIFLSADTAFHER
jgi:HlyD family secretion protein/adhesin transport system membrane fusion protein